MAAAVAVLHGVHAQFDVRTQPVEVWNDAGQIYVTAAREVAAKEIWLPACIPKQMKLLERSEHPHAVPVKVTLLPPTEALDGHVETAPQASVTYMMCPEFRAPSAVAEATGAPRSSDAPSAENADTETAVAEAWAWGVKGQVETMHPFWAVRRMTRTQLKKLSDSAKADKVPPRFNCGIVPQVMSCVTLGLLNGTSVNTTRCIEAPCLINVVDVGEGEELIMEVPEKTPQKTAPKRTWKAAFLAEAKDDDRAKKREQKVKTDDT